MNDHFDKDLPESIRKGQRLTTMTSGQARFPDRSRRSSSSTAHGKSGTWVSELLPYTAKIVDDLCVIKTVHTEAINHDPAITYICTGSRCPAGPAWAPGSATAWAAMNKNLPAFVVMTPSWTGRKEARPLFTRLWGSGFLPSKHQGVALRSQGDPVLYLQQSARRRSTRPAGACSTRSAGSTSSTSTRSAIPKSQTPHRPVRDGLPHADLACRT